MDDTMLDLSKIEITEVDRRTLRGVLKFTVEITAPTDGPLLALAKNHLLFRFFTKFYGEIFDEVDHLFNLALSKCNDQHEIDELTRQWGTLRGLSRFHTTIDRDFKKNEESVTQPVVSDTKSINFREFL